MSSSARANRVSRVEFEFRDGTKGHSDSMPLYHAEALLSTINLGQMWMGRPVARAWLSLFPLVDSQIISEVPDPEC